ncbi:hypothetical protein HMPREF1989_00895 [Porphyromonas gingivalis F0566]|nr:hypothetical protein HMPREF1989_00895 [Porphyromonas gingivalis F0566]
MPASVVCSSCRDRAKAENRIKELNDDFSMDSIIQKDWWATGAMINMAGPII